ncbi:uncharacterized protein LOC5579481 [Aedes aegypti]|uniref:Uncharacterized protein n=1 Tax=Aedes aegypti TaxID=7159 RepID=A0A1S4G3U6_AEDAE|nr:uncharacterized protein LOC5579481 [Aedes aegypti]
MQMNDSGHETDDRLEALFFDNLDKNGDSLAVVDNQSDSDAESDIYSKINDFDVVFHDPKGKNSHPVGTGDLTRQIPSREAQTDEVSTQIKATTGTASCNNRRVLTSDNSTDSYASSITNSNVSTQEDEAQPNQKLTQINTCKILQRKLELKVERAKRNYRQMYEEQDFNHEVVPKSASLIPISRLPIPGGAVIVRDLHQLLVDVNPSDGNSDEDDLEPVSFFPKPNRKMAQSAHTRQELSDTFSIQEMTIESDQEDQEQDFEQCRKLSNSKGYKKILNRGLSGENDYLDNDAEDYEDDDDDSQNLELLPPNVGYNLKEWAQRTLCCFRRNDFMS